MAPFRFSLASLIGTIALLALCLAALQSSSQFWVALVVSGVLATLITAVAGACFAKGNRRVFWGGLSIFGWCYLALALGPWTGEHVGPNLVTTHLLTSLQNVVPQFRIRVGDKVLVQWGSSWYRSTVLTVQNGQYLIHYDGYSSASDETVPPTRIKIGRPESFFMIGHSFFAIIVGLVGGVVALYISRRQPLDPETASPRNIEQPT